MTREPKKRCRKCKTNVKVPTITKLEMVTPKGNKNAKPRPMVITRQVRSPVNQ